MKKTQNAIIPAIIAVAAIQMGTNAISPILSDLSEAFPAVSASTIQFLMTCPSIMVIVFGLLTGVLSRVISKRLLSSLGCGLFALSGILSWLFHESLTTLFVWAIMMGSGIGIAVPIALGSVNEYVEQERQQSVMGWIIASSNLGAMAMTFFGGILSSLHWSYNYLVYLIALPGLLLTLLLYPSRSSGSMATPVAAGNSEPADNSSNGISAVLRSPGVMAACFIALLSTMLFNVVPTNLSMLLSEKAVGTSLQAGTGTTIMLLSGTLIGLVYGRMAERIRSWCMVFAFSMIFIGQLLCCLASSIRMIYLGCFIAGMSQSVNMAYALMLAAKHARGNTTFSASLVTSMSNLGAFCTPLITILASLLGSACPVRLRFLTSVTVAAAAAILIALFTCRQSRVARR